eukprot:TRINITY_DN20083_c0_g1_i2.p1 TRINITY_DN20083_c0_g1~~TRINITY_DN20083_c0_g1_i2.p1  ORF type:complete len:3202 (+),score=742.82 TRINITY_DN20083_c0_g1_i2:54-9608(+)
MADDASRWAFLLSQRADLLLLCGEREVPRKPPSSAASRVRARDIPPRLQGQSVWATGAVRKRPSPSSRRPARKRRPAEAVRSQCTGSHWLPFTVPTAQRSLDRRTPPAPPGLRRRPPDPPFAPAVAAAVVSVAASLPPATLAPCPVGQWDVSVVIAGHQTPICSVRIDPYAPLSDARQAIDAKYRRGGELYRRRWCFVGVRPGPALVALEEELLALFGLLDSESDAIAAQQERLRLYGGGDGHSAEVEMLDKRRAAYFAHVDRAEQLQASLQEMRRSVESWRTVAAQLPRVPAVRLGTHPEQRYPDDAARWTTSIFHYPRRALPLPKREKRGSLVTGLGVGSVASMLAPVAATLRKRERQSFASEPSEGPPRTPTASARRASPLIQPDGTPGSPASQRRPGRASSVHRASLGARSAARVSIPASPAFLGSPVSSFKGGEESPASRAMTPRAKPRTRVLPVIHIELLDVGCRRERMADIEDDVLREFCEPHAYPDRDPGRDLEAWLDRNGVDAQLGLAGMLSHQDPFLGRTALHEAALRPEAHPVITLAAQRGADLLRQDWRGQTALHLAAARGVVECVHALLIADRNRMGRTPATPDDTPDHSQPHSLLGSFRDIGDGEYAGSFRYRHLQGKGLAARVRAAASGLLSSKKNQGHAVDVSAHLASSPLHSVRDALGRTALTLAAQKGCIAVVRILVDAGALGAKPRLTLQERDELGIPLGVHVRALISPITASLSGDLDVVRLWYRRLGWSCGRRDAFSGCTLLHWAAIGGRSALCRLLVIECGEDPSARNNFGRSPVHEASSQGDWATLTALLSAAGASREAALLTQRLPTRTMRGVSRGGATPLHLALQSRVWSDDAASNSLFDDEFSDDACLRILRCPQLDYSATDGSGRTVLHVGCAARRVQAVRVMLRCVSDSVDAAAIVNARDDAGDTALGCAVKAESAACVSALLAHPAVDVHVRCSAERHVLLLAADVRSTVSFRPQTAHQQRPNSAARSSSVALLLVDACGPAACSLVSGRPGNRRAPLHVAVASSDFQLAAAVLSSCCCALQLDDSGNTPLSLASELLPCRSATAMLRLMAANCRMSVSRAAVLRAVLNSPLRNDAEALQSAIDGAEAELPAAGPALLSSACEAGHVEVAAELLQRGCSLPPGFGGLAAMLKASSHRRGPSAPLAPTALMLYRRGDWRRSPAPLPALCARQGLWELLGVAASDPQCEWDWSASVALSKRGVLHFLCEAGRPGEEVAAVLARCGAAGACARDAKGRTPFEYAVLNGAASAAVVLAAAAPDAAPLSLPPHQLCSTEAAARAAAFPKAPTPPVPPLSSMDRTATVFMEASSAGGGSMLQALARALEAPRSMHTSTDLHAPARNIGRYAVFGLTGGRTRAVCMRMAAAAAAGHARSVLAWSVVNGDVHLRVLLLRELQWLSPAAAATLLNARARAWNGRTALHCAAQMGDWASCTALLDTGYCDVDPRCDEGCTPLAAAAAGGHTSICTILIAAGADGNVPATVRLALRPPFGSGEVACTGLTPLTLALRCQWDITAAQQFRPTAVAWSLSPEAAGHPPTVAGTAVSPLHVVLTGLGRPFPEDAALCCLFDIAAAGPGGSAALSLWRRDGGGRTVVEVLLRSKRAAAAAHLIRAHGADPWAACADSSTPLHLFAAQNCVEGVRQCCSCAEDSALLEARDTRGDTPLTAALRSGCRATAAILLELGAEPRVTDESGRTALSLAASVPCGVGTEETDEVFRSLLRCTPRREVDAGDRRGLTALHYACRRGATGVALALVHAGADPTLAASAAARKVTPPALALLAGHDGTACAILRPLLRRGVSVGMRAATGGESLLHHAAVRGCAGAAGLLVDADADGMLEAAVTESSSELGPWGGLNALAYAVLLGCRPLGKVNPVVTLLHQRQAYLSHPSVARCLEPRGLLPRWTLRQLQAMPLATTRWGPEGCRVMARGLPSDDGQRDPTRLLWAAVAAKADAAAAELVRAGHNDARTVLLTGLPRPKHIERARRQELGLVLPPPRHLRGSSVRSSSVASEYTTTLGDSTNMPLSSRLTSFPTLPTVSSPPESVERPSPEQAAERVRALIHSALGEYRGARRLVMAEPAVVASRRWDRSAVAVMNYESEAARIAAAPSGSLIMAGKVVDCRRAPPRGPDYRSKFVQGAWTLLHACACYGLADTMRAVFEGHADEDGISNSVRSDFVKVLSYRDHHGYAPLHYAIAAREFSIAACLLSEGAQPWLGDVLAGLSVPQLLTPAALHKMHKMYPSAGKAWEIACASSPLAPPAPSDHPVGGPDWVPVVDLVDEDEPKPTQAACQRFVCQGDLQALGACGTELGARTAVTDAQKLALGLGTRAVLQLGDAELRRWVGQQVDCLRQLLRDIVSGVGDAGPHELTMAPESPRLLSPAEEEVHSPPVTMSRQRCLRLAEAYPVSCDVGCAEVLPRVQRERALIGLRFGVGGGVCSREISAGFSRLLSAGHYGRMCFTHLIKSVSVAFCGAEDAGCFVMGGQSPAGKLSIELLLAPTPEQTLCGAGLAKVLSDRLCLEQYLVARAAAAAVRDSTEHCSWQWSPRLAVYCIGDCAQHSLALTRAATKSDVSGVRHSIGAIRRVDRAVREGDTAALRHLSGSLLPPGGVGPDQLRHASHISSGDTLRAVSEASAEGLLRADADVHVVFHRPGGATHPPPLRRKILPGIARLALAAGGVVPSWACGVSMVGPDAIAGLSSPRRRLSSPRHVPVEPVGAAQDSVTEWQQSLRPHMHSPPRRGQDRYHRWRGSSASAEGLGLLVRAAVAGTFAACRHPVLLCEAREGAKPYFAASAHFDWRYLRHVRISGLTCRSTATAMRMRTLARKPSCPEAGAEQVVALFEAVERHRRDRESRGCSTIVAPPAPPQPPPITSPRSRAAAPKTPAAGRLLPAAVFTALHEAGVRLPQLLACRRVCRGWWETITNAVPELLRLEAAYEVRLRTEAEEAALGAERRAREVLSTGFVPDPHSASEHVSDPTALALALRAAGPSALEPLRWACAPLQTADLVCLAELLPAQPSSRWQPWWADSALTDITEWADDAVKAVRARLADPRHAREAPRWPPMRAFHHALSQPPDSGWLSTAVAKLIVSMLRVAHLGQHHARAVRGLQGLVMRDSAVDAAEQARLGGWDAAAAAQTPQPTPQPTLASPPRPAPISCMP